MMRQQNKLVDTGEFRSGMNTFKTKCEKRNFLLFRQDMSL